jgi:hypothetical protein
VAGFLPFVQPASPWGSQSPRQKWACRRLARHGSGRCCAACFLPRTRRRRAGRCRAAAAITLSCFLRCSRFRWPRTRRRGTAWRCSTGGVFDATAHRPAVHRARRAAASIIQMIMGGARSRNRRAPPRTSSSDAIGEPSRAMPAPMAKPMPKRHVGQHRNSAAIIQPLPSSRGTGARAKACVRRLSGPPAAARVCGLPHRLHNERRQAAARSPIPGRHGYDLGKLVGAAEARHSASSSSCTVSTRG